MTTKTNWKKEKVKQYEQLFGMFNMSKEEAVNVLDSINSLNNEAELSYYLKCFSGTSDMKGGFILWPSYQTLTSIKYNCSLDFYKHISTKKYIQSLKEKAEYAIERDTILCFFEREKLMELSKVEHVKKSRFVL